MTLSEMHKRWSGVNHTLSETGPDNGYISKFEVEETIPLGKASEPTGLHLSYSNGNQRLPVRSRLFKTKEYILIQRSMYRYDMDQHCTCQALYYRPPPYPL